jgi:membrane protease YdiL (CAAX protease family)
VLSQKPWKVEWILLLGAALMLSWSLGMLLTLVLGQWLQPKSPADPKFYQFLMSAVSFHGVALVLTHRFLKAHEMTWKEFLGFTHPGLRRALVLALGAAVIMVPTALVLNFGCRWLLEQVQVEATEQATVRILRVSFGWARQAAFGFGAIVLAPVVEEILFRAILYPFLKQHIRPWQAALFTCMIFAGIHLNLVTFLPLLFVGLVLVTLYEWTDTLIAPILTHALFNAVNFGFLLEQMRKAA